MVTTPKNPPLTCSLHDWDALRSQLLFALDNPIPDGSADGTYARHGQYSAHLIRRGWLRMDAEGERVEVRPGQWLFCFADRIHQQLSPDMHILSIRMSNAWPNDTQLFHATRKTLVLNAAEHPQLELLAVALVADMGAVEQRTENPIFTYRWRTRLDFDTYMRHQQHVLAWTVLAADIVQQHGWTLRIPRGIDTRLAKVLALLDDLEINAPFPRAPLQGVGGLTVKQLDRMCRSALGMTLRGYWDQRRLHAARFRLDQPASSIKETAVELGFAQLSHFSAWFKRYTGLSPRAYRTQQRSG